jgi:hypothetical protein
MSAYFTQPMHPDFHSNKTEAIAEILTLHSHQGVFLKKLTVVIQQGPTGEEVALLTVAATKCPKEGYVSFEPPETR